jgi:DNA-binding NtrC family response regulator
VTKIAGGMMLLAAIMPPARPLALIIEDDSGSAEALSLILRDWGAEVAHGADGAGAEAALGGRVADVRWIITDFHLGRGPDGVTLVKRLTQSAPQARVLVLSGSFHGRATDAATLAGFEVMQKPARAEAIVAWLERA